jgi:hypothetical protein
MWRLLTIAIGTTLMSTIPAVAEETISLKELQEMAASGKLGAIKGFIPRGVAPDGRWEFVPIYAPPRAKNGERSSNIVGVTEDGQEIFCFCGGTSF